MAKLFPVFLVTSVVSVQLSASIMCYVCIGYNSSLPFDKLTNNPFCVSENFKSTEVERRRYSYGICQAGTLKMGSAEITARLGDTFLLKRGNYFYDFNYVCDTDLCNDKPTSSAGTPSLLSFLLVPALLTRLLV